MAVAIEVGVTTRIEQVRVVGKPQTGVGLEFEVEPVIPEAVEYPLLKIIRNRTGAGVAIDFTNHSVDVVLFDVTQYNRSAPWELENADDSSGIVVCSHIVCGIDDPHFVRVLYFHTQDTVGYISKGHKAPQENTVIRPGLKLP